MKAFTVLYVLLSVAGKANIASANCKIGYSISNQEEVVTFGIRTGAVENFREILRDDVQGLGVDPKRGDFYILSKGNSKNARLNTLDPDTGNTREIFRIGEAGTGLSGHPTNGLLYTLSGGRGKLLSLDPVEEEVADLGQTKIKAVDLSISQRETVIAVDTESILYRIKVDFKSGKVKRVKKLGKLDLLPGAGKINGLFFQFASNRLFALVGEKNEEFSTVIQVDWKRRKWEVISVVNSFNLERAVSYC